MTIARLADVRRPLAALATTLGLLGAATLLIALLADRAGLPNASAVYLIAVVGVAVAFGTVPSMLAAVAAFLLDDFLFVQPIHTFTVADAGEWLNLILLLLVGIVVGQLGATERNRADAAEMQAREARALFQVSRALATREATTSALDAIVEVLARESRMRRVWVELGAVGPGRIAADSLGAASPVRPTAYAVLARAPGDTPARWVRIHEPVAPARHDGREVGDVAYRVNIEATGRQVGVLWGLRAATSRPPSREETRMLAASADQVGQAIEQDRLRVEAASAELARRSDAVKTALLDSVSHDLRTPLATIRAAAGSLMDPEIEWPVDEGRAAAASIDREAERLNRLVTNLLDLSRIEAGELRVVHEAFAVDDLVQTSLRRLETQLGGRAIEVAIAQDLPPVDVDATFIDQILTNLIENALAYVPADAPIRIRAEAGPAAATSPTVRLTVEDGGPGVPDAALGRLFEKFYRVAGTPGRRGTGIGLAVARGFVEAMGGRIDAGRSELGGLAITVDLPLAAPEGRPT